MGVDSIIGWGIAFVLAHAPSYALSYIAPPSDSHSATIIIGGDMMFDRTIRSAMRERGGDYIFSCIDPILEKSDLTVANLEGPITESPSKSEGTEIGARANFLFTFPTSTAALLAQHNIRMVNIGNNHISNFKISGVRATEKYLTTAGVQWFGDPILQGIATTTIRGVQFAFINFNQFERTSTASTTIAQIATALRTRTLPIVFAHWGDEYREVTEGQRALAHKFINAGAAIVVGSHPHIVQIHEVYRGKYIYYSLGNFIFDQYWSDAVRSGILLFVSASASGVDRVREIPIELEHDRRTCPSSGVSTESQTIELY